MKTRVRAPLAPPVHRTRLALALTAAVLITCGAARALTQAASGPVFEVASVKANRSGTLQANAGFQPNGLNFINLPLKGIIQLAYRIPQPSKLVGVPDWANTERFDIVARAGGTVEGDDLRLMLRALLADRFKMVARLEKRTVDVYSLVVAKKDGQPGEHLRPTTSSCTPPAAAAARGGGAETSAEGAPVSLCGLRVRRPGTLVLEGAPIAQFANILSQTAGRSVFNKTGLTGSFDIELTYAPDSQLPGATADGAATTIDPNAPSLFTALQEQLGLKLESTQEPDEVLVVQRLERPSEN
jgi:uncharacterized protein (TIGR03435 family)